MISPYDFRISQLQNAATAAMVERGEAPYNVVPFGDDYVEGWRVEAMDLLELALRINALRLAGIIQ